MLGICGPTLSFRTLAGILQNPRRNHRCRGLGQPSETADDSTLRFATESGA
jgi:hypothetical protein